MKTNKICNLNLIANSGISARKIFTEMKKLQKMGIANDCATITLNNVTIPAGIYDSFHNYFATYEGVIERNKEKVIYNLPSGDYAKEVGFLGLCDALQKINGEFTKRGMERFSNEEIEELSLNCIRPKTYIKK